MNTMELWESLGLNMERDRLIALVGGGGKTTLLYALAREAWGRGRRVIVTTTTHILPHPGILLAGDKETLMRGLAEKGIAMAGRLAPDGKVGMAEDIGGWAGLGDIILIEADGSRGLPLKAPAAHEPAIPPWADVVIAVAGLDCIGKPIKAVCHRPERVCALLGREEGHFLSSGDVAAVFLSLDGGRRDVGLRTFRCVLNKADGSQREQAGREIQALLRANSVGSIITKFAEEERGGLCWF